jgi:rSAM/selenodomain-associated transferase 1
MAEPITIAVLAKAPMPGLAKTRLIPALGADGAAALAAKLIERTVATCSSARLGPVTLWAAPDEAHPLFAAMREKYGVALACQPDGDLGARMHAATVAAESPVLVVGTDCPALTTGHLQAAAEALRHHDVVVIPAEDGGYVLIGMQQPQPDLFREMKWSTASVMDETRRRMTSLKLSWHELAALWDIDTPRDLARLKSEGGPP